MEFPCMYKNALVLLSWFGIADPTECSKARKITHYIFNCCLVVTFIDYVYAVSASPFTQLKVILELSICSIFSFVSVYALLLNRHTFGAIFHSTGNLRRSAGTKNLNRFIGFLLCMLVIHPLVVVATYYMQNGHFTLKMYSYEKDFDKEWVRFSIVFVKIFCSFLLHPILPSLLGAVFCMQCYQCCAELEALTRKMQKFPSSLFTNKALIIFLDRRERIVRNLHTIHELFSLPSFFLCSAHFSCCLGYMAVIITYYDQGFVMLTASLSVISVSSTSLLLIFWVAGRVPIELKNFKREFKKKAMKNVMLGFQFETSAMERFWSEEEDLEMSGCGLIIYRRSSILGVLGSILTYGLLILSIEVHHSDGQILLPNYDGKTH